MRRLVRLAALAGLALAVGWPGATVMRAQSADPDAGGPGEAFSVEGQVVNGTAGAAPPADLQIKVVSFADEKIQGSWDASLGDDGHFVASGIPVAAGATYVLASDYEGATYVVQVTPPDGGGAVSKDLTVYESVTTDPGIRFDQSAVIVTDVDTGSRAITVTELHTIVNPTDRTFAPQMGGPGGPAGLLVFGLPPNSFDLTPGLGLDPSQIVEIGLGFASLTPIFPGRREISFSYRFPYTSSQAEFQRTVRYPVDTVRVLAETPGPAIASQQLAAADNATIGGHQYRILSGGPLGVGDTLRFTVDDLPVPGGIFARIPPAAPAAMGALVGAAVIALYWRRTRRAPPIAELGASVSSDGGLVEQLVALEEEHAAGRISDAEFNRSKAALLERAGAPDQS